MITEHLYSLRDLIEDSIHIEEYGEISVSQDASEVGLESVRVEIHPDLRMALLIGTLEILIYQATELTAELKELHNGTLGS